MTDFLMDLSTNDYDVSTGRIVMCENNIDLTKQRLQNIFNTFTTTLFTNVNQGIDIQYIRSGYNKQDLDQHLKSLITDTTGIVSLDSFTSSIDKETRVYTVSFDVTTLAGQVSYTTTVG